MEYVLITKKSFSDKTWQLRRGLTRTPPDSRGLKTTDEKSEREKKVLKVPVEDQPLMS
jgi:hypothetical protein